MIGVERFYLYDHGSTDNSREVLKPYIARDIVRYHYWSDLTNVNLIPSFDMRLDCVQRYGHEAFWIAFFDADEFLLPVDPRETVSDILEEFEAFPALVVPWVVFGDGYQKTCSPGLVTERFRRCEKFPPLAHIKTIAQPRYIEAAPSSHFFLYKDGRLAVDELQRPVTDSKSKGVEVPFAFIEDASFTRIRMNHYALKSYEEYVKYKRTHDINPDSPVLYHDDHFLRLSAFANEIEELTIQRYMPELRRRVAFHQQQGVYEYVLSS